MDVRDDLDYPLADAITALRAELSEAQERAGNLPRFSYDKVELTVTLFATSKSDGKLKLSLFDLGGEVGKSRSRGSTVEVKLTLHVVAPRNDPSSPDGDTGPFLEATHGIGSRIGG